MKKGRGDNEKKKVYYIKDTKKNFSCHAAQLFVLW